MWTWSSGPSRRANSSGEDAGSHAGVLASGGLSDLDRLTPQARAVQLQQVEDVEERAGLVAPVAEQLKGSPAFLIATHHLAVDEAGPNLAMVHGLHDENNPAEQTFGFACVDNATLRINPRTPAFR
jgi:hypothetical protein